MISTHLAASSNNFELPNEIGCIEVLNNDSVQLNLSSSFNSVLYSSSSLSGPYSEYINPGISNGGFTLGLSNGNTQLNIIWYFFHSPLENLFSDTLSNIVLDVDPLNGAGIANLSWNQPFTSAFDLLPNSHYSIMREYPVGVWEEIAEVAIGTQIYLDTITICDAYLNYRVDLDLGLSCIFLSNVSGDIFNNNTPPDIP